MKRLRSALAAAFVIALACATAQAQVTTAPTIKIKQPKPKIDKFKGEVLNSTPAAITVRDPNMTTTVRTFSFDPKLKQRMENRYIENGSRVTVRYIRMSDTAVGLSGKIIPR